MESQGQFIWQLIKGECPTINGDGKQSRDFGTKRFGYIRHSNADVGKAGEMPGYEPEWGFERKVQAAIE